MGLKRIMKRLHWVKKTNKKASATQPSNRAPMARHECIGTSQAISRGQLKVERCLTENTKQGILARNSVMRKEIVESLQTVWNIYRGNRDVHQQESGERKTHERQKLEVPSPLKGPKMAKNEYYRTRQREGFGNPLRASSAIHREGKNDVDHPWHSRDELRQPRGKSHGSKGRTVVASGGKKSQTSALTDHISPLTQPRNGAREERYLRG